jgi:hypothetical protein
MSGLANALRLNAASWRDLRNDELGSKALTVVFAYGLMAFNRFGLIAVLSPRALLRMLLIGFYGWLGLAAVGWFFARSSNDTTPSARLAAVATGVVHSPLIALGIVTAFVGGFARIQGPALIAAWLLVGLWMPALLAWAYRRLSDQPWSRVLPVSVGAYAVWLVTVGRHMYDQVGHLL